MQKDFIAIVHIEGSLKTDDANSIMQTLEKLERNNTIRAIVLKINSPGGTATAIHEIYFKLLKVRESKPVVVSIDSSAASGAYFISLPANFIFAKQSSEVGSIGVIAELPTPTEAPEIIASGPYKTRDYEPAIFRAVELLQKDFLDKVKTARKGKLTVSDDELLTGKVYFGFDALSMGLIDEIGGLDSALEKAKELAKITRFETVREFPTRVRFPLLIIGSEVFENTTSVPVFHYLHVRAEDLR